MRDIDSFLQELSSAAPVPGGGSVAALSTAMGAALLVMVANLTLGRRKYEGVQAQIERIEERADYLRDRARALADEDVRAYGIVAESLGLPKETEAEKAERRDRIQLGLKGAARPPLDVMRIASDVVQAAGELVEVGNRSAITDVGSAALMGVAGFAAARLNVDINLALITDDGWVRSLREEMGAIPDPAEWNERIQMQVLEVIRGDTR